MAQRPLRWFEIPIALVLLVGLGTPLFNILSGRVTAGASRSVVVATAVVGGLCFALLHACMRYFTAKAAVGDLARAILWEFVPGTVFLLAWLTWHG